MSGPRYPLEGVVSWNMNTTCNYRCTYCTQRFVDDRGAWARDEALRGEFEMLRMGAKARVR